MFTGKKYIKTQGISFHTPTLGIKIILKQVTNNINKHLSSNSYQMNIELNKDKFYWFFVATGAAKVGTRRFM